MGLLTACALPGFLTGSLVTQIREDFALSEAVLGVAFSVWWGSAAIGSTPASRLVERLGPTWSMRLAGLLAAASCAAITLFVSSPLLLVVLLAVGGLSLSAATPGANALLVRAVPAERQALAFGLAQSSPPIALLMAGLGVPLVAEPFGWRPVFAGAAVLALVMAAVVPRQPRPDRQAAAAGREAAPNLRPLAITMAGVTLGNAALGAMNAFLVAAAPGAGVPAGRAALTLALGSAISVPVRIVFGLRADRRRTDPLPTVAALLVAGTVGFALVTTQQSWLFLGGALLVLVFGWGWMGLFTYAVVTRYVEAPAAATGVMQTGFYAGGVLGPVGFGLLVEAGSFTLGWVLTTVGMLAAAGAVFGGRRLLPPHRLPDRGEPGPGAGAPGPPGPVAVAPADEVEVGTGEPTS